jgi:hypothetical protein
MMQSIGGDVRLLKRQCASIRCLVDIGGILRNFFVSSEANLHLYIPFLNTCLLIVLHCIALATR